MRSATSSLLIDDFLDLRSVRPALAAVLSGDLESGGRLPVTFAADEADYEVFDPTPVNHDVVYESEPTIGYRQFPKGISPRFAFGHGLGYATFAIEDLEVTGTPDSAAWWVTVSVRNTSLRPGKKVVQVYVQAPDGIDSGAPELKAFTALRLEPGESRRVELQLDERAFRHWQPGHGWIIAPGRYQVYVGRSSQDLPLQGSVDHVAATEPA